MTNLFNGNDLAFRIIAKPVEEMFRRPWASDASPVVQARAKELRLDEHIAEAKIAAREYGGAGIIIGCSQGAPETPLPDSVRGIDYLYTLDRRFLVPATWDFDPASPSFGQPLLYRITPPNYATQTKPGALIHASRILRFDGEMVDVQTRVTLLGWGLSVLQRIYPVLRKHDVSWEAAGNLISDFAQGVFKIKGAMEAMSSNNGAKFLSRMALADMTRSTMRALVIDTDGEDFERVATPMTGFPEMVDRFMMRLSAAADMPVSVLFGRAPQGMNATGDMDVRTWYDSVASDREKTIRPAHERVLSLLAGSPVVVTYAPLWEPTDLERAQVASAYATADASNVNAGIVTPEEVALSRWDEEGCLRAGMEALDFAGRKTAMVAHPYEIQAEQKQTMAEAAVTSVGGGDSIPETETKTE